MDTARSGFLTAFEHFWNGWGAGQSNLLLIVCGSSSSWLTDKVINNKGGLYNRATYEIKLKALTLKECEEFYKANNIVLDRYDQIQAYMIMGGIPYYLSLLQKGMSLAQNIDNLYFSKNGKMRDEFNRLFRSLFTNPDDCIKIVRFLGKKREGYLRKEIAEATHIPYGGGLTNILNSLEESGFILTYIPFNCSTRETRYKLVDHFCLFYLYFMDTKTTNESFWQDNLLSPSLNAWRGYAFENVCFSHIPQIKNALGISGVHSEYSPWRGSLGDDSAQVDLVINRDDRVINLCEIKYCGDDFYIDKRYDKELRRKIEVFTTNNPKHNALHITLITTFGLKNNEYSSRVQKLITMDQLF